MKNKTQRHRGTEKTFLHIKKISSSVSLCLRVLFYKLRRLCIPKKGITTFVESLGTDLHLPADFDEKEAYRKHVEEKYVS